MKLKRPKSASLWRFVRKAITLVGEGDGHVSRTLYLERSGKGYKHGYDAVAAADYDAAPASIKAVHGSLFSGAMIVFSDEGLYVHVHNNTPFFRVYAAVSGKIFFVDAYRDGQPVSVAFYGKSRAVFNGATVTPITAQYSFYTGAMHCGRFFGRDYSDAFLIRWSADGVFDWTTGIYGSGHVYLPPEGGEVIRLVSMGERLIAVRRRGVTVINAYGDPQHFSVKATAEYAVADGIIEDTCAVCDGKLFFCTRSGIYAFDGDGVKKLENGGKSDISSPVSAVAYGDKYYLICSGAALGEGLLYIYDASAKSGYFTDIKPDVMCVMNDGVYVIKDTVAYRLDYATRQTRGYLFTGQCDFGSSGVKYLREIYVEGDSDVRVEVTGGSIVRTFTGCGRHRVGMAAPSFSFAASAYGRLDKLIATAEVKKNDV